MTGTQSQKFYKDFLWYFAGSIIPAAIALFRVPVFTRYFTPEEYGYFTLVSSTFTYISVVLYSWISSCLWRFYIEAKKNQTLNELYSNLFFLSATATIILFTIAFGWLFFAKTTIVFRLVGLSFFQLVTGQILSLYLIIVRIKERAFYYNLVHSIQAAGAFGILFLFAFGFKFGIESILIGQVIINLVLILFVLFGIKAIPRISFSFVTKHSVRELITYGAVGLFTNLGVLLLISADRYIIALYADIGSVGIYNQVYMLGQFSIYHLVTVFFNTINPRLVKLLSFRITDFQEQIAGYIRLFIFIILPLTFYFSLFSKQIADIMLGEKFRTGYTMIPYIMFSSFVFGLAQFNESKLKFEGKYRSVITGVLVSSVLNIALNFFLIPVLGYQIAAVTTFFSYICLFLFLYFGDNIRYFSLSLLSKIGPLLLILVIQGGLDSVLRLYFNLEIGTLLTVIEGILFLAMYFLIFRKQMSRIFFLFTDNN